MPNKQTTKARNARAAAREGEKFTTALRRQSSAAEVRAGEDIDRPQVEFSGEIFQWRGPAPYYFVAVPEEQSLKLKAVSSGSRYYRGMIRVQARIGGDTEWPTSLWPRNGCYVVPVRDSVRKPLGLADGDTVTIHLTVAAPAPEARRDSEQAGTSRAERNAPRVAGRCQPRSGDHQRVGRSGAGVIKGRKSPHVTDDQLRIVPANEASWEDLEAIFGVRGFPSRCLCQMHRLPRGEDFCGPVRPDGHELASRLREQTGCGQPDSETTTGLVAYLDGEPVGWCAVDSRPGTPRLLSHGRVPWMGRTEDKTDESVWAVTCFLTRAGYRRRGICRALARAAVDFARQRGARALEGYPHTGDPWHSVFADAGLAEVNRPTLRRIVMRIDF